ncbi:UPF0764 protein C16orf89 homolog [Thamnophis elegans]|uniref:UPF0764 protein C16orf89 homolog n=1 Tax=Thamnophis elegans TaxID=35005 RepID=UPI001376B066|nr:UPF0764 protein C16orf89 homolog [Thamnophis elegans]
MTYMLIYTNPTYKKENKDRFFTVYKKPLLVSPALPDAKMLNFVFLTLICLVNLQPSSCEEDRRNAIISSMEKAIMFLAENHDKINVDAVLGFSVLEAFLKNTVEIWQQRPELTIRRQRILVMREKLLTFTEKAAQDIEKQDPVSHKEFAPALKPGFWKVPQEWKKINDSIPYSPTSGNCLDLKTSDFCISAVLGTQDSADKCWIPDNCTSLMINTHCNGYLLSHQLFYFLFAKMQACPNSLFQNAGYYENVFCHLMMQSNRYIEKNNLFDNFGDLFTENIMFCALAGFSDFFQTSWLDRILNWQEQDKGCFWMYTSSNDKDHVRRRTKRSEKLVEGTCSSHNTAVSVGALGGFLLNSA